MEEKKETEPSHKKKKIVIPGELITTERKKAGQHVFIENGKIYSNVLGITYPESDTSYVVPLNGVYVPQRDDLIVGIVQQETVKGYVVDINSIYTSYISDDKVREKLQKGSVISAKVDYVNEINEADLFDVRVFYGGEIIQVNPAKVPRMIGKAGSMLTVLKEGTGCSLILGRNGWIWVKGGDTQKLTQAINLIETESHLNNLTTKVERLLKEKKVN